MKEWLINYIKCCVDIGADITLTEEDAEEIIKALKQKGCDGCIFAKGGHISLYNQCKHCMRYYGDNYKSESGDNQ